MENNLISVVIPVYGVETYLEKCLNSVCTQTYKNLEIIVIDDGSPDHSGWIADSFAARDSRVIVKHIENKGAAGARNVGLSLCTGNYVSFIDSDDWVDSIFLESLMDLMTRTESDIVQCQFYDEYVNRSQKHTIIENEKTMTDEEFIEDMLSHWEDVLIWNKLFKRDAISGVVFTEGRCIDDEFFTYKTIIKARKIALSEKCLYHYRSRKSSAMGNSNNQIKRAKDQIDFVTERYPVLSTMYPKLKNKLLMHKAEVYMHVMRNNGGVPSTYKEARALLSKCFMKIVLCSSIDWRFKVNVLKTMFFKTNKVIAGIQNIDEMNNYYD